MKPIWRGAMVFALLALAAGCARGEAAENAGRAASVATKMPVDVVTLADVPIQDASEYLAQLVSRTQVAIYPQVSGVVTSIFVKPGQVVREGAALLQDRSAAGVGQPVEPGGREDAARGTLAPSRADTAGLPCDCPGFRHCRYFATALHPETRANSRSSPDITPARRLRGRMGRRHP